MTNAHLQSVELKFSSHTINHSFRPCKAVLNVENIVNITDDVPGPTHSTVFDPGAICVLPASLTI